MSDVTHFAEVADQKGFVVAFPDGISGSWNAGVCCGIAAGTGVDDVGFVSDLVDRLLAEYCVDPKRVFATGFSNGGFLSHRLACELPNKIAAVASVSGVMGIQKCAPPRAVPVLQIHGTSDPIVPYNGNALLGYPSVDATMSGWVSRNGCGSKSEVSRAGSTHCDGWSGCRDGGDVELCTVEGGDHGWPGGGTLWTDAGPPAGFVASTAIVDFFDRHPMR
jgi:polyhydroxybutyrate depolymerase